MLYKLKDAIENENSTKKDMVQSSIELKKVVNLNTISGYEYKCYIDNMWNMAWNYHKEKCHGKINWLVWKQNSELEMIVHTSKIDVKRVENTKMNIINDKFEMELQPVKNESKSESLNVELEMIAQNNILINVEKEYEGLERTVQIENENSKNYSELEMKVQNNIC